MLMEEKTLIDEEWDKLIDQIKFDMRAGFIPPTRKASQGRVLLKNERGLSKKELVKAHMNSRVLAKDVYLSFNAKYTQRNTNTLIFGGSGTGKSRYIVKPAILNAAGSYIITDPSGELLSTEGNFLRHYGDWVTGNKKDNYRVRILNVNDVNLSHRYNPMYYIRDINDIPVFVDCLIQNLGGASGGNNRFWDDATKNLLQALVGYLYEAYPVEQRTFANLTGLLRMVGTDENAEVTPLDLLFQDWELKTKGRSFAVNQYKVFKSSKGETSSNILISTSVRISSVFDIEGLNNLTCRDEMFLDEVGSKRTAIFLIIPIGSTTYNFLTALLISQLFSLLYKQGDDKLKHGASSPALDYHVDFLLDEMANIGKIPNLDLYMSTVRKYNIGLMPILQGKSQLKQKNGPYEAMADILIGNCDTKVYLGGDDEQTLEWATQLIGKITIHELTTDVSTKAKKQDTHVGIKGRSIGKDELARMDNAECIVFMRGEPPIKALKYDLESHPNYKFSGDADEKYALVLYDYCNMAVQIPNTNGVEYIIFKIDENGEYVYQDDKKIPVATLSEWLNEYEIKIPEYATNDKGDYINEYGHVIKKSKQLGRMAAFDENDNLLADEPAKPYLDYDFPNPTKEGFKGAYVDKSTVSLKDILGMESEFSQKIKTLSEKAETDNTTKQEIKHEKPYYEAKPAPDMKEETKKTETPNEELLMLQEQKLNKLKVLENSEEFVLTEEILQGMVPLHFHDIEFSDIDFNEIKNIKFNNQYLDEEANDTEDNFSNNMNVSDSDSSESNLLF